jgi:DNA-binding NtrC family response regulator
VRPATTRILLTGYSDLEAIIGSVNDSEVFRFVSKPWKRDDLSRTMAAAVAQARQADTHTQAPAPAAPAPAQTKQAGADVLVLDSNSAERQALVHTLSSEWTLHAAGTIDEALSCIRDSPNIGVVLTESIFEGGAVTSLVNALRRARPELVYIVITHEPDAGHIIDLINFGRIYRVLRKPLRASVLRGAVNVANHRHQQLRRDPERAKRLAGSVDAMPEQGAGAGLFNRIRTLLGMGRSRPA